MSLLTGVVLGITGILFSNSSVIFIMAVPLKGFLSAVSSIASIVSSIGFLKIKLYSVTFAILFAAAGLALFFAVKDRKVKKYVALLSFSALLINILFSQFSICSRPEIEVVFADVGQGDATLVILKTGESILIDSGGTRKGVVAIEGMLDFYNIKYPTIYIATHTHEDHCGAMVELIRERGGESLIVPKFTGLDSGFDQNNILCNDAYAEKKSKIENDKIENESDSLYPPANNDLFSGEKDMGLTLLETAFDKNLKITETGAGDVFSVNKNLKLKILSPDKSDSPERRKGGNESSMVIQIIYKIHKILIMGDATDKTEQIISRSGMDLSSNIFRISHHGSPKSTNHDIINAVNPKTSIISVGFNLYGHPSEKVIKRLRDNGSEVFRTDETGAIIYRFDRESVSCETMIG
jgi:beta-lactamase superfamily II metal-dependent hydrolase